MTRELLGGALVLLPQELIWEADCRRPIPSGLETPGPDAVNRLNEANPIQSNGSSIRTTSFGFSTTDTHGYVFAQDPG
jgi:hypothetical protein